jgi:hypothetical protein
MSIVVDHQPSVVENVFPAEIVTGLYKSHCSLSEGNLCKYLGESKFKSFKEVLNRNVLVRYGEEFVDPVVPLYYYRKLEKIQSEDNREALKLHGSSHGVIEGLFHPECRLLWRRILEISEDTILHDKPKENAISIKNNGILITSLLPIEEIRATYLRDWSRADLSRRKKLQEFQARNVIELCKAERWKALIEWPYIIASKSVDLLRKAGLNEKEINNVIRKCDLAASKFELLESKDWIAKEDNLISNLPYLVSILKNSEKIREGTKTIDEVINDLSVKTDIDLSSFQISTYFNTSKLKSEELSRIEKGGLKIWKAWKLKNVADSIVEGELARASLYYIADYIVSSLILVEGETNWRYEVLIPKMMEYEMEISKIVAKVKFLLLKVNPTFGYNIEPGNEIKAFDTNFVFPIIKSRKESLSKIKELFEDEDDFCKEIEKELENYGKHTKLEEKIDSILNMSPDLFQVY